MASGGSTTRWCPTPEQVMLLEEMYRSGVRTPNAAQIQQITAQLSCYGRIEGKNVFYWFQNHKARERQKLRRRLSRHYHHLLYCQRSFFNNPPPLITAHHALQHYHTAPAPSIFLNNQQEASSTGTANFGCCRAPLKTLDLFPTSSNSSAGAEEEEPNTATVTLMAPQQGIS